jgi:tetratricopeptide (TPR) repeat protein
MYLGRSDEGIGDIETALRLSPHENQVPEWQTRLCFAHELLGQWEQAIDWCTKVAVDNPSNGFALAAVAGAYASTGHDKEAKDLVAQLKKVAPTCTVQLWQQHRVSDDPTFNAQMDRAVEGLRKAGVPEGPVKTN